MHSHCRIVYRILLCASFFHRIDFSVESITSCNLAIILMFYFRDSTKKLSILRETCFSEINFMVNGSNEKLFSNKVLTFISQQALIDQILKFNFDIRC